MVGLDLLEQAHRIWTVGSAGLRGPRQRIEKTFIDWVTIPLPYLIECEGRCVGGDFEWVGSVSTISTPII